MSFWYLDTDTPSLNTGSESETESDLVIIENKLIHHNTPPGNDTNSEGSFDDGAEEESDTCGSDSGSGGFDYDEDDDFDNRSIEMDEEERIKISAQINPDDDDEEEEDREEEEGVEKAQEDVREKEDGGTEKKDISKYDDEAGLESHNSLCDDSFDDELYQGQATATGLAQGETSLTESAESRSEEAVADTLKRLERKRQELVEELERDEQQRQWFYTQLKSITHRLEALQLHTDTKQKSAQTESVCRQLEAEAHKVQGAMQETLGTAEQSKLRQEARLERIRTIEAQIMSLQAVGKETREVTTSTMLSGEMFVTKQEHEIGVGAYVCDRFSWQGGQLASVSTQTGEVTLKEYQEGLAPGMPLNPSLSMYHGAWPIEKGNVSSHSGSQGSLPLNSQDLVSVISFNSTNTSSTSTTNNTNSNSQQLSQSNNSSGGGGGGKHSASGSKGGASGGGSSMSSSSSSQQGEQPQQLGTKVEMLYSLLSMLGTHDKDDMSRTLFAMSQSQDSCIAMRQSGCLPLLLQLLHGSDEESGLLGKTRGSKSARARAAAALHNIVHCFHDDKRGRREARTLRLLEQIRAHCDQQRGESDEEEEESVVSNLAEMDHHPGAAIAALMKLSFDEDYRHAICTLGGLQAIAELLEIDSRPEVQANDCGTTVRRYSCMALTNLTFGDGKNKALLCSMRPAMEALVRQLNDPSEDLCQAAASVLRNLSWRADLASKKTLREIGAVGTLMRASMCVKKETTLKSILSALWNLSSHCSENKAEICAVEGALQFLVSLLTYKSASKTLAIVENGGGILRNVSSQIAIREDYREILRKHGCLQLLLHQLRSPSLTIVSNACGTLWNLSARCEKDQTALRDMGAVGMLRNLIHSRHKMISSGSSAALRNLLSSVGESDRVAGGSQGVGARPSLHARKQRGLEAELARDLSETCENVDSPRNSPTEIHRSESEPRRFVYHLGGSASGGLGGDIQEEDGRKHMRRREMMPRNVGGSKSGSSSAAVGLHGTTTSTSSVSPQRVARAGSQDSVGSTHSDISHDRAHTMLAKSSQLLHRKPGGSLERQEVVTSSSVASHQASTSSSSSSSRHGSSSKHTAKGGPMHPVVASMSNSAGAIPPAAHVWRSPSGSSHHHPHHSQQQQQHHNHPHHQQQQQWQTQGQPNSRIIQYMHEVAMLAEVEPSASPGVKNPPHSSLTQSAPSHPMYEAHSQQQQQQHGVHHSHHSALMMERLARSSASTTASFGSQVDSHHHLGGGLGSEDQPVNYSLKYQDQEPSHHPVYPSSFTGHMTSVSSAPNFRVPLSSGLAVGKDVTRSGSYSLMSTSSQVENNLMLNPALASPQRPMSRFQTPQLNYRSPYPSQITGPYSPHQYPIGYPPPTPRAAGFPALSSTSTPTHPSKMLHTSVPTSYTPIAHQKSVVATSSMHHSLPQTFNTSSAYAETDLDQPTDFSLRYSELSQDPIGGDDGSYQEQPINYSMRFSESGTNVSTSNTTSDGPSTRAGHCVECKYAEARRANEQLDNSSNDDQLRTFCTEGTPYLSTATSLTDLTQAGKLAREEEEDEEDEDEDGSKDRQKREGERNETGEQEEDEADMSKNVTVVDTDRTLTESDACVARSETEQQASSSDSQLTDRHTGSTVVAAVGLRQRQGLLPHTDQDHSSMSSQTNFHADSNEGALDQTKTYCEEGTPVCFSRVSSLSSLHSSEANAQQQDGSPQVRSTQQDKVELSSIEEAESPDAMVISVIENKNVSGGTPDVDGAESKSAAGMSNLRRSDSGQKTDRESKTVTFDENHQVEETPLMFSRSSSPESLSSLDTQSVHSSVVSEYSRRASEVVSPSEIPDSPSESMPPSPRRAYSPTRSRLREFVSTPKSSSTVKRSLEFTKAPPQVKPDSFVNFAAFDEEDKPINFAMRNQELPLMSTFRGFGDDEEEDRPIDFSSFHREHEPPPITFSTFQKNILPPSANGNNNGAGGSGINSRLTPRAKVLPTLVEQSAETESSSGKSEVPVVYAEEGTPPNMSETVSMLSGLTMDDGKDMMNRPDVTKGLGSIEARYETGPRYPATHSSAPPPPPPVRMSSRSEMSRTPPLPPFPPVQQPSYPPPPLPPPPPIHSEDLSLDSASHPMSTVRSNSVSAAPLQTTSTATPQLPLPTATTTVPSYCPASTQAYTDKQQNAAVSLSSEPTSTKTKAENVDTKPQGQAGVLEGEEPNLPKVHERDTGSQLMNNTATSLAAAKTDSAAPPSQKSQQQTPVTPPKATGAQEDKDSSMSEVSEGEEDILAQCISSGMPTPTSAARKVRRSSSDNTLRNKTKSSIPTKTDSSVSAKSASSSTSKPTSSSKVDSGSSKPNVKVSLSSKTDGTSKEAKSVKSSSSSQKSSKSSKADVPKSSDKSSKSSSSPKTTTGSSGKVKVESSSSVNKTTKNASHPSSVISESSSVGQGRSTSKPESSAGAKTTGATRPPRPSSASKGQKSGPGSQDGRSPSGSSRQSPKPGSRLPSAPGPTTPPRKDSPVSRSSQKSSQKPVASKNLTPYLDKAGAKTNSGLANHQPQSGKPTQPVWPSQYTRQDLDVDLSGDQLQSYATEGTPLNFSNSTSLSDLSMMTQGSTGQGSTTAADLAKKCADADAACEDANSDSSSVCEESEELLLSQTIQCGMPQNKSFTGSARKSVGGNTGGDSSSSVGGGSDLGHHGGVNRDYNPSAFVPRSSTLTVVAPFNEFVATDTLKSYNVEGTPRNFSAATSLSDLTIDSIDGGKAFSPLKIGAVGNNGGKNSGIGPSVNSGQGVNISGKQNVTHSSAKGSFGGITFSPPSNDTMHSYGEEGTPLTFSRQDSLSSLGGTEEPRGMGSGLSGNSPYKGGNPPGSSGNGIGKGDHHSQEERDDGSSGGGLCLPHGERHVIGQSSEDSSVTGDKGDKPLQFAVEDTPVCFSRNSSLSSLNSSEPSGFKGQQASDSGTNSRGEVAPSQAQDSNPNTQSDEPEKQDDSDGDLDDHEEQALLEQCINSAMPKSRLPRGSDHRTAHVRAVRRAMRGDGNGRTSAGRPGQPGASLMKSASLDIPTLGPLLQAAAVEEQHSSSSQRLVGQSWNSQSSLWSDTNDNLMTRSCSDTAQLGLDDWPAPGGRPSRYSNWHRERHASQGEFPIPTGYGEGWGSRHRSHSQESTHSDQCGHTTSVKHQKDLSNKLAQAGRRREPERGSLDSVRTTGLENRSMHSIQRHPGMRREEMAVEKIDTEKHISDFAAKVREISNHNMAGLLALKDDLDIDSAIFKDHSVLEVTAQDGEDEDGAGATPGPGRLIEDESSCTLKANASSDAVVDGKRGKVTQKGHDGKKEEENEEDEEEDDEEVDGEEGEENDEDYVDKRHLGMIKFYVDEDGEGVEVYDEGDEDEDTAKADDSKGEMEDDDDEGSEAGGLLLEENAQLIVWELQTGSNPLSLSAMDDDMFLDNETISLVSNDYTSDTNSEASMPRSVGSPVNGQRLKKGEKSSTATGLRSASGGGGGRPRILKPGEKSSSDLKKLEQEKAAEVKEEKGIRGKRKPLYPGKPSGPTVGSTRPTTKTSLGAGLTAQGVKQQGVKSTLPGQKRTPTVTPKAVAQVSPRTKKTEASNTSPRAGVPAVNSSKARPGVPGNKTAAQTGVAGRGVARGRQGQSPAPTTRPGVGRGSGTPQTNNSRSPGQASTKPKPLTKPGVKKPVTNGPTTLPAKSASPENKENKACNLREKKTSSSSSSDTRNRLSSGSLGSGSHGGDDSGNDAGNGGTESWRQALDSYNFVVDTAMDGQAYKQIQGQKIDACQSVRRALHTPVTNSNANNKGRARSGSPHSRLPGPNKTTSPNTSSVAKTAAKPGTATLPARNTPGVTKPGQGVTRPGSSQARPQSKLSPLTHGIGNGRPSGIARSDGSSPSSSSSESGRIARYKKPQTPSKIATLKKREGSLERSPSGDSSASGSPSSSRLPVFSKPGHGKPSSLPPSGIKPKPTSAVNKSIVASGKSRSVGEEGLSKSSTYEKLTSPQGSQIQRLVRGSEVQANQWSPETGLRRGEVVELCDDASDDHWNEEEEVNSSHQTTYDPSMDSVFEDSFSGGQEGQVSLLNHSADQLSPPAPVFDSSTFKKKKKASEDSESDSGLTLPNADETCRTGLWPPPSQTESQDLEEEPNSPVTVPLFNTTSQHLNISSTASTDNKPNLEDSKSQKSAGHKAKSKVAQGLKKLFGGGSSKSSKEKSQKSDSHGAKSKKDKKEGKKSSEISIASSIMTIEEKPITVSNQGTTTNSAATSTNSLRVDHKASPSAIVAPFNYSPPSASTTSSSILANNSSVLVVDLNSTLSASHPTNNTSNHGNRDTTTSTTTTTTNNNTSVSSQGHEGSNSSLEKTMTKTEMLLARRKKSSLNSVRSEESDLTAGCMVTTV